VGAASNDGDITGHISSTNYFDNWLVKVDSAEAIQWERSYGGTHSDIVYAMKQTTDGGFITVGYSESIDVDVTNHHDTIYTSDYWVVKLFPPNKNDIKPIANKNNFTVYPNPTSELISINSTEKISSIKITNVLGELVYFLQINATSAEINLSNLPNGNYLYNCILKTALLRRKL